MDHSGTELLARVFAEHATGGLQKMSEGVCVECGEVGEVGKFLEYEDKVLCENCYKSYEEETRRQWDD